MRDINSDRKILFLNRCLLFLIWAYFVISIINSACIRELYISPDSSGYLREAEALKHGYGFNYDGMAGGNSWFASWPIGYPALIALISGISGLNVYLCSKILSMILIALLLLTFEIRYQRYSWLIALSILNKHILFIYLTTWSETCFFPTMIVYIWMLAKILRSPFKIKYYVYLALVMILAFLFRYFGIVLLMFSYLICFSMFIYCIGKRKITKNNNSENDQILCIKRKLLYLICSCIFTTIIELCYLFTNYKKNGNATGIARTVFADDLVKLKIDLFNALIEEINGFIPLAYINNTILSDINVQRVITFSFVFVIIFILVRRKKIDEAALFVVFGLFYYGVFIIIRFNSSMDTFNFRFFSPATALIFMGLLLIFVERFEFNNIYMLGVLLAVILSLSSLYIAKKAVDGLHAGIEYKRVSEEITDKLKDIPSHSIILNYEDDIYAEFIRPDIAFYNEIVEIDRIDEILEKHKEYKHIYVDMSVVGNQDTAYLDKSKTRDYVDLKNDFELTRKTKMEKDYNLGR